MGRATAIAGLFLSLCAGASAVVDPNYVLQGQSVPAGTIRIIALGTGTPTVARDQVATSYLLQLGGTRNVLFDVGTGSIANLYDTGVDLSTIDTVWPYALRASCSRIVCFARVAASSEKANHYEHFYVSDVQISQRAAQLKRKNS